MSEIKLNERAKVQINKEYKLTAIVLVYNGEKYLRPCLDSLVSQTLDDLEILLINDASTDDSLSICMEYERDYENVFIIDKAKNGGLASSANLGISLAKGEYVVLVDNDDIVPSDAYEKLYDKAKETNAEISIGQAVLLHEPWQHEISGVEQRVWVKERIIHDLKEFPTLFHDAFYWNKIIKKDLLVDNNIELADGMIYADRKFSHTAYIHANTISIIPDCVYLWRIRKNDKSDESLSSLRREAWNYENRIDSYELDLDMLTNAYSDYFKILMKRVIVPVKGILESKEFEDIFYKRGQPLLKKECLKLDNVYDNDLYNFDNIVIFLLLNDYKKELEDFLKLNISNQRELLDENGKTYWKLPLFRNPNLNIPDELFEIKYMTAQFINIGEIEITDNLISFKNIKIPNHINYSKGEIIFIGRTGDFEKIVDNRFSFEIEKEKDLFKADIDVNSLRSFEIYDIFFRLTNDDKYESFRISNQITNEIKNSSNDVFSHFTANNNLAIGIQKFNNKFSLKTDQNSIKLLINEKNQIKDYLKIMVRDIKTGEETYFDFDKQTGEYSLKWQYFLDKNSKYELNFVGYENKRKYTKLIKINEKDLTNFKEVSLKTDDNIKVGVFKNNNSAIFIKS